MHTLAWLLQAQSPCSCQLCVSLDTNPNPNSRGWGCGPQDHEWPRFKKCERSNVGTCFPQHGFSNLRVPGAVGFVVQGTITTKWTNPRIWGWCPQHNGWPRLERCGRSNVCAVLWSPWHVFPRPFVLGNWDLKELLYVPLCSHFNKACTLF